MGSKKRQSVYDKKTQQRTVYVTREADQKLKAAMTRAGRPGRRATASDVITFCLIQAADLFDREGAEQIRSSGSVGAPA